MESVPQFLVRSSRVWRFVFKLALSCISSGVAWRFADRLSICRVRIVVSGDLPALDHTRDGNWLLRAAVSEVRLL